MRNNYFIYIAQLDRNCMHSKRNLLRCDERIILVMDFSLLPIPLREKADRCRTLSSWARAKPVVVFDSRRQSVPRPPEG